MPKHPTGHKRPAHVTTGKVKESAETPDGKNPAAVQLGRKGGLARARKLGVKRRREIAREAAAARWKK